MRQLIDRVESVGSWARVRFPDGVDAGSVSRAFTLNSTGNAPFTVYCSRSEPDGSFLIPRGILHGEIAGAYPSVEGEWPRISCEMKPFSFRDGQESLVNGYLNAIKSTSPYGGIIKATPGAGKTVMGLKIATDIGLRTLIIVPTDYLMTQWIKRIKDFTGCHERQIGIVKQDSCDYHNKDFVVAMIHSLTRRLYDPEFYNAFGLVIFDEIHFLGAETFSKTAPMFHCKYRLGLSATPRRKDGMENIFMWHIGPIVSETRHVKSVVGVVAAHYHGHDTSHDGCVWGGKLNLGRYLNRLERSTNRNNKISQLILTASAKREGRILLLTDRLGMIERIKAALISRGIPASEIGLFTGAVKQVDRRILLGTYGSAGTGADLPTLEVLILASPRTDIEQAIGRALRHDRPLIIDVVDDSSTIMTKWFEFGRMRYYRQIKATVKHADA